MNHILSPDTGDAAIEREILAKGLTAPRVTPADVEAAIDSEHYFTAGMGVLGAAQWGAVKVEIEGGNWGVQSSLDTLTFCVLTLKNGFTVTGESACASLENFNYEIGKKIARENAKNKIWALLGFMLKEKLAGEVA